MSFPELHSPPSFSGKCVASGVCVESVSVVEGRRAGSRGGGWFLAKWAVVFSVCGFQNGCTLIPKISIPAPPVPARFSGNGRGSKGYADDVSWSDFFKEPRLRALLTVACENNRDLRQAVLRVEQSRAQYRVVRSQLAPGVDARADMTRAENRGAVSERWTASAGVTAYEVDVFGRIRSLNRQALENYLSTDEARRSVQIALIGEVATRYFALRHAEEQLKLAHETLSAVKELYALNKAIFDAGAANELNLRTSEGQVQSVRVNVITYEREVAQARNALVFLIGADFPPQLPAARPFLDGGILEKIPVGLPSGLVLRRADILQSEHDLRAANANVGAARAAFFPQIRLTGSLGASSDELTKLFGSGTGVWSFAPQISVPVFTGGRLRANLDAARVEVRIKVAAYERSVQSAFREVMDALVAMEAYREQGEVQRGAIGIQRRRLELAGARYRQGEDPYLNVLSAQQDLYSVEQGRLATQYNWIASQIGLYKALGGGWK